MRNFGLYHRSLSLILLVLLLTPASFAFSADDDDAENIAALKENTLELVRETSSMALTLRSPGNRINFAIVSADILWDLDENDSRGIFNSSAEDIKRLMSEVDFEKNQQDNLKDTNWANSNSTSQLNTKINQAFSLRSAMITALANHDPDMAMRFLQETGQLFTNPTLLKRIERENKRLDTLILKQIAAKDVTKALELGHEKLSKGVTSEVTSLLTQIYAKDKEKGVGFAKSILQKLKSSNLNNNNTWIVIRLFQYGLSTINSDKTPLYNASEMRELGDILAKQITSSTSRYRNVSTNVMSGLEKYAPNSAAQIKRTLEQRKAANNRRGNGNRSGSSTRSSIDTSRKQMWEERSKFQNDLSQNIKRLSDENLTSQEKQAIINESKDKILSVNNESFRLNNLISLAIGAARAGEKDSASGILYEAEAYIKQDPKQKSDFSNSQRIANAYAIIDPDRSFAILENMIYRLNGVINGYTKFMEFSGNGRVVENNELVMSSYSRQFTNYLRFSPESMKSLAEADFRRLKDLSDKFERPEVRIETRLLIAKALLTATLPRNEDNTKKVTGSFLRLQVSD